MMKFSYFNLTLGVIASVAAFQSRPAKAAVDSDGELFACALKEAAADDREFAKTFKDTAESVAKYKNLAGELTDEIHVVSLGGGAAFYPVKDKGGQTGVMILKGTELHFQPGNPCDAKDRPAGALIKTGNSTFSVLELDKKGFDIERPLLVIQCSGAFGRYSMSINAYRSPADIDLRVKLDRQSAHDSIVDGDTVAARKLEGEALAFKELKRKIVALEDKAPSAIPRVVPNRADSPELRLAVQKALIASFDKGRAYCDESRKNLYSAYGSPDELCRLSPQNEYAEVRKRRDAAFFGCFQAAQSPQVGDTSRGGGVVVPALPH